jgi:hypothetical protein
VVGWKKLIFNCKNMNYNLNAGYGNAVAHALT